MDTRNVLTLTLGVAAVFFASGSGNAQPVSGWGPTPTLEDLQTGLLEMVSRLHLTHAQHEHVERIIANETMQLALTRRNPNLSVARTFSQEHAIRMEARRQIEAILTPRQAEKVAKRMIHEMEERQRWSEDRSGFFSIPAAY
jgi:hypothetical protein